MRTVIVALLLLAGAVHAAPPPGQPALDPPRVEATERSVGRSTPGRAATVEWVFHRSGDGLHPDGEEQAMLWLLNRARQDPAAEGIRLASSTEPDVAGGRDFFGVDLALLRNEFAAIAPRPPAAFDARLYEAARAHALDLIARDAQDHRGQFDRVEASGFRLRSCRGNVFSFAESGLNAHAGFNIDWGPGDGTGMQPGRGHRGAIMGVDGNYANVGISALPEVDPATDVGPLVVTGNYCEARADGVDHFNRFLVGTVWQDRNGNGRYDPGEGHGGVLVMPDQGTYFATTAAGGGYAIPVTAGGTLTVAFSGGGVPGTSRSVTVGDGSVPLDYRLDPTAASTHEAFVRFLYEEFYGRGGDPGGVRFWSDEIEAGRLTPAEVAARFFLAAEFQDVVAPVARLYLASLGRLPDSAGLVFWVGSFRAGMTLEHIAASFLASGEFGSRFGPNPGDAEFLDLVYLNVLGRLADPGGQAFWASQLARGLGRPALMLGFSESREHVAASADRIRVALAHEVLLRRPPTAQELAAGETLSLIALLDRLLASPEYAGPPLL